jgi:hypothetical protein
MQLPPHYTRPKVRKQGRVPHIELLTEAKLETVFEVFRGEQDAINSFFPNREVKRYDILEFVETKILKRPKS